jgi:hypothetical protein
MRLAKASIPLSDAALPTMRSATLATPTGAVQGSIGERQRVRLDLHHES